MAAVAAAAVLAVAPAASFAQGAGRIPQCTVAGPAVNVPELPEGSGVAASRRVAGRFYSHNDSGKPVLVMLDASGKVTGHLAIPGAELEDWEAIAVGPCPAGSCIYVGDIGDNDAERSRITIYRLPEPEGSKASRADVIHATYPDGAHDAEALLVDPDGRLYIVTKGDTGPVAVYAFPRDLRGNSSVRLERIGSPRQGGRKEPITDGAVSPDGTWAVLRTNETLLFYPAADLLAGRWKEAGRTSLTSLGEPQGEGVTIGAGNTLYLVGEGGGKSRAGTFARLSCKS